jgi:hypothetical protein
VSHNGGITLATSVTRAAIGVRVQSTSSVFNGYIDEFHIFTGVALSGSQIDSDAAGTLGTVLYNSQNALIAAFSGATDSNGLLYNDMTNSAGGSIVSTDTANPIRGSYYVLQPQYALVSTYSAVANAAGSHARTLSLWFKQSSNAIDGALLSFSDTVGTCGTNTELSVVLGSADEGHHVYISACGGNTITGSTALAVNAWHYAAVTYSGTAWQIYTGANLNSNTGTLTSVNTAIDYVAFGIRIASVRAGPTNNPLPFSGILDEIHMFNALLSASDITLDRTGAAVSTPTQLIAAFDGTSSSAGTRLNDIVSGATATLVGGARAESQSVA